MESKERVREIKFCSSMVTPCWRGGGCPYLRRRCCLFGHSSEEVAAASLVGVQPPERGPTWEEHQALVTAFRRLAAAVMWSRGHTVGSQADQGSQTAPPRFMTTPVVEANPVAKYVQPAPMPVTTPVVEAPPAVDFSANSAPPMSVSTPVVEAPPAVDLSAESAPPMFVTKTVVKAPPVVVVEPLDEYAAPTPAGSCAVPVHVVEYFAPAPAGYPGCSWLPNL